MFERKTFVIFVLGIFMLGIMGCAIPQANMTPWLGAAATASFTAIVQQKPDLPLQGGMEVSDQGGRMALVTQHGRTLGQCTWQAQNDPMILHCEAAEGLGIHVQGLVQDVALAVYAGLLQRAQESETAKKFVHNGNSGNIEITFTGGQK